MSVRFKNFIYRIGRESGFNPQKNGILIALSDYAQKESENKRKNYPRLMKSMTKHWEKYKERSQIAHLLNENYEEIFNFYLTTVFPFQKKNLILEDSEALTPVDFKLKCTYNFTLNEIQLIKALLSDLNLHEKLENVLNRVFLFSIISFGPLVKDIFQRPYTFQPATMHADESDNGEWKVIINVTAREQ